MAGLSRHDAERLLRFAEAESLGGDQAFTEDFPEPNGTRLPPVVARWLGEGGRETLTTRRGERALAIERSNGSLLLREEEASAALTSRAGDPRLGRARQDEPRDRTVPLDCAEHRA